MKSRVLQFFTCMLAAAPCAIANDALGPSKNLAPVPPIGWMSWNFSGEDVNEKDLKEIADALVDSGMRDAGYRYVVIDDGWQGGRDNRNNIVADPKKFPSGIKALADFMHARGLRLGIYSDAAPLTCAGYTASLHFEQEDAATFASWGIDYLKYDYCNAPTDAQTAAVRYRKMADALSASGRDIVFGICEWGDRQPWQWAAGSGGHLWRTTEDIRNKWRKLPNEDSGAGILDVIDINAGLDAYAGDGRWNDADMLIVGLYDHDGPASLLGGNGAGDVEYRSQFSLWAMMNSPLFASNDVRRMSDATRRTLLNTRVIALNQDPLGKQAARVVNTSEWSIFVKPLADGDTALAILNRGNVKKPYEIKFHSLGLNGRYSLQDLWLQAEVHSVRAALVTGWKGSIDAHETKVLRLTPEHQHTGMPKRQ